MSATKSQVASSSASPFSYDVFLSFRALDTGRTFTDHLYTALNQAGFHTFRDKDDIEVGEDIYSPKKVIRESRMSIIVLSKNYASSIWCLEELVTILECRTFGHIVLPVFYDVDPSEVREQIGSIKKEAFMRHVTKLESEIDELAKEKLKDKLRTWRAALREVASLAGMVLQNQVNGHDIQKIIEAVEDKLSLTSLNSAPNLVETLQVNAVQSFNWFWPRLGKLVGFLSSLVTLNLSHSYLAKTPDFSKLPNLEKLVLKSCTSLVEVHESIGCLKRLVLLHLEDCKRLRNLPSSICMLKHLETLVISGCSNLNMESSIALLADGIVVNQSLPTNGLVNGVQSFNWLLPLLPSSFFLGGFSMSATKSQEASSSASPFSYDVFISFMGVDTRNTFTDHLYTALDQAGFHTFRDIDDIEIGKDIYANPEKVIRESRMSIIVFSKTYALSTWCLEQLVMILKQRTFGHIVLPIFYDVDPSEVGKQIGIFEEAFTRHENQLESETDELAKEKLKDKLQTWRAALTEVANLTGMVLQVNGHEARFIQKIIEAVEDNLSRMSLNSAPNLVGTLQVNGVQSFNWPWPRLRKLVGISPLFSRAKLLHVWPGLNFWYYLAIISSPAWVFSFLAMDFIKKTTDLVFIFLISTLALSCFAINFMLSQFYFSLPSIPETDRFFRGYQRAGKTIGYTLLFFSNVGLYYFTEKSVACMLTFLFLAFYCLCALFCIQPYTDFGALEFLLSACMNQTLSLFGLGSSYSWLVIIACIVLAGIRFHLEPAEATTDEVDLESGHRNT